MAKRAPPPQDPADETFSKEHVELFVRAVAKHERRRKIMLGGYLLALVLLVGGQLGAFWIHGSVPRGTFVGWVFLIPFAAVAIVLWIFGRWSNRVK